MKEIFDSRFALVPFCIHRVMITGLSGSYTGWTRVRVFGFQVAKIQGTKPWE